MGGGSKAKTPLQNSPRQRRIHRTSQDTPSSATLGGFCRARIPPWGTTTAGGSTPATAASPAAAAAAAATSPKRSIDTPTTTTTATPLDEDQDGQPEGDRKGVGRKIYQEITVLCRRQAGPYVVFVNVICIVLFDHVRCRTQLCPLKDMCDVSPLLGDHVEKPAGHVGDQPVATYTSPSFGIDSLTHKVAQTTRLIVGAVERKQT